MSIDLDEEWERIDAVSQEIRARRPSQLAERLNERLVLLHRALALAVVANEHLAGVSMGRLDRARAELLAWTTARVFDVFREYAQGNFAGGLVLHRAAIEGYAVLAACLVDDAVAVKFADFGFVSQAEARRTADPTHPDFTDVAPQGMENVVRSSVQAGLYKAFSTIAHPTRFATFFQSEPEAITRSEVEELDRSWVLIGANWPKNTDVMLGHLLQLALSLADTLTHFPLTQEEHESLMRYRDEIGEQAAQLWPTPPTRSEDAV